MTNKIQNNMYVRTYPQPQVNGIFKCGFWFENGSEHDYNAYGNKTMPQLQKKIRTISKTS